MFALAKLVSETMVTYHRNGWETETSVPESGRSLAFISSDTPYSFNLIFLLNEQFLSLIPVLVIYTTISTCFYWYSLFLIHFYKIEVTAVVPAQKPNLSVEIRELGITYPISVDQNHTKMKTMQISGLNTKCFIVKFFSIAE